MEFGLFNALYLPHEQASDPVAEHRRLLDEVTSIQAAAVSLAEGAEPTPVFGD